VVVAEVEEHHILLDQMVLVALLSSHLITLLPLPLIQQAQLLFQLASHLLIILSLLAGEEPEARA
jgi:hypothetical protein